MVYQLYIIYILYSHMQIIQKRCHWTSELYNESTEKKLKIIFVVSADKTHIITYQFGAENHATTIFVITYMSFYFILIQKSYK